MPALPLNTTNILRGFRSTFRVEREIPTVGIDWAYSPTNPGALTIENVIIGKAPDIFEESFAQHLADRAMALCDLQSRSDA